MDNSDPERVRTGASQHVAFACRRLVLVSSTATASMHGVAYAGNVRAPVGDAPRHSLRQSARCLRFGAMGQPRRERA
eukprot:4399685-Lingulodinium_polyedra.AAC.1